MRIKLPSTLTVLTSVLLILLPALAVMQYRWVGQVSDAERNRMQRNLRVAAAQFRQAFDDEVGRAMNNLRADTITVRESAWYRYSDRYETWSSTAEHPAIVASVFLVDADSGELRLRRWNTVAHRFDPAAWPPPLMAWRTRLEQAMASLRTGEPPVRAAFPEDDSFVVAPVLNVAARPQQPRPLPFSNMFGFTVVQLDMAYVGDQFLPALAQRHFTQSDGDQYRVAVVRGANPDDVVYRSDPDARLDVAQADEAVSLYGGFRDPRFIVQRRTSGGRGDGRRRDPSTGSGSPRAPSRGDRDDPPPTDARGRFDRDFGRWTLLVQHESGSLEAAVAGVRRRNLGISFGILILLGGSVGLLAASSRRAQRLARQQMEFVAGMSHELRTPVAVIRSAAENLAHGVIGSGDRVKRYGEMIEAESRRLGEMVERVLQYAGMASGFGAGARVPVAPSDLIESAIESATPTIGPVNVQRTIDPGLPPIVGDESALRSAVQNLIANAVKYGGPDGWVGVRAQAVTSGRSHEVHITVEDRGPGIPGDELPHIFEPFYRGRDAIARQVHGNGLGLALVRQIVSAHDGRISVSTRAGGGSSFTIALPAADADARAPLTTIAQASSAASGAHS